MKRLLASLVIVGLLFTAGCANSIFCTYKNQEITILTGIVVGANALADILPSGSAIAKVVAGIANDAKTELAANCPNINTVANLQTRLADATKSVQAAGYKLKQ